MKATENQVNYINDLSDKLLRFIDKDSRLHWSDSAKSLEEYIEDDLGLSDEALEQKWQELWPGYVQSVQDYVGEIKSQAGQMSAAEASQLIDQLKKMSGRKLIARFVEGE